MPDMTGFPLEDAGREMIEKMDFVCAHRLGQVRKVDIDPQGSYSEDEHVEFDYLIPHERVCLVGEMKGTGSASSVKAEFRKFKRSFNWLKDRDLSAISWRALGVPQDQVRTFRNVRELRGFFVTPYLQRFDCALSEVHHVACFYKSDWNLITDYAHCIGPYAKQHLLSRLDVPVAHSMSKLNIGADPHFLIRSSYKRIASGNIQLADLFTFQISPYQLLPLAQVYRRDELPNLSSSPTADFQRPLIRKKLNSIRKHLLTEDFMFPNSILVVLSHDSEYHEGQNQLSIPQRYGAVSVIDGQHRLFAYADEEVRARLNDECTILVTAIRFRNADEQLVRRFSAKTFVEVNTSQTAVQRTLLDAIAYDVLGETNSRAIAAQVLLRVNEQRGALYGLFDTNQTGLGKLRPSTVLTSLQGITNMNRLHSLRNAKKEERLLMRQGYELLCNVASIEDLSEPEQLIQRVAACLQQYFNIVAETFMEDWPKRGQTKNTSFEYAKVVAAFVRLLSTLISEGLDWPDVRRELSNIRDNVLVLRTDMSSYDGVLFDPEHPDIPDAQPSETDDYHFLDNNRKAPTSIRTL